MFGDIYCMDGGKAFFFNHGASFTAHRQIFGCLSEAQLINYYSTCRLVGGGRGANVA